MTADVAEELLGQFCGDLRQLWQQAGGPSLRVLSGRVGLGKSQVGAILGGEVRRMPDWEVVRGLVGSFQEYAREHGRAQQVSIRMGVDEFWRPRYTAVESAFRLAVEGSRAAGNGRPADRPVPRQLPAAVRCFVGRCAELAALNATLDGADGGAGTVVISSIHGMAGVGKTALAVEWAHQVTDRFPDGQLYVDLRGYDPDQPVTVTDALARFLTALGVSGTDIPLDADERAARYRTEVVGRRMLIVLDNASSVEQVRPLLPGTATATVMITSRDSLAGLVARDGARRLNLDVLPPAEAQSLLRRLIGPRADDEPDAVSVLAEGCARLPLALRVAAELATSRPATTLTALSEELADQQQRLELLDGGGDPHAAVTTVFSWSIRHLPPEIARTFRLLGLHPGPDFDGYATAALADVSLASARRTLDLLARAHLVQATAGGRYGMHDLLRAYAADRAAAEDTDHHDARDRLFDYYVATAATAMDRLHPAETDRRPRITPCGTPIPELAGAETARGWLDAERACLLAVTAHSATHAVHLSAILWRYLDGGHHIDAITLHTNAHRFARQVGDPNAQANALFGIGTAHTGLSQYPPAGEHLRQALTLFEQTGHRIAQHSTHNALGIIAGLTGRHQQAADHFSQALTLARELGYRAGEGISLANLGVIDTKMGHNESAIGHLEQALTLFRHDGNSAGIAYALDSLGLAEQRLGRYEAAAHHLEEALALCRRLGARHGEARALDNLGIVYLRRGHTDHAAAHLQEALTLFREVGDQEGQTWALNGIGETAHAAGDPTGALVHHAAALAIAVEIGVLDQQARAHAGLGHAHRTLDNPGQARDHYERALALYTELDATDAHDIDAHLATLRAAPHRP